MKRYKLVRIVNERYFSANTTDNRCIEYKIGEMAQASGKGMACYKTIKYATHPHNLREAMFFNGGKPVAVLVVEPTARAIPEADIRYRKGGCYEGGINYPAVRVAKVLQVINSL